MTRPLSLAATVAATALTAVYGFRAALGLVEQETLRRGDHASPDVTRAALGADRDREIGRAHV